MTDILYEADADLTALDGQRVAVVGYGNQGRSWALNLRDSGVDVVVCVRADETRESTAVDGFDTSDVADASRADVICLLVPDDVIPELPIEPRPDALVIVASGYTLAFDRLTPPGDAGMVAARMLGPEVRRCSEEGVGFITAVGVHADAALAPEILSFEQDSRFDSGTSRIRRRILQGYKRRRILGCVSTKTPNDRGPGRPAVGTRVPVRLPPDVLDDIDRRARVLGRSRASVIRSLLGVALGHTDDNDDGVDRAQIRRMLDLSPSERVRHMSEIAAQQERVRRKARRPDR